MTTTTAPKLEVFSLKAPLLSEGNVHNLLGKTDALSLHIKVYARGGENRLHTHLNEDHSFVVLDGQATFYDKDGNTLVVNKYQGALVSKGAFYRFHSSGEGCLVMLRVAAAKPDPESRGRIGVDGKPTHANENPSPSVRYSSPDCVTIPGKFFGA